MSIFHTSSWVNWYKAANNVDNLFKVYHLSSSLDIYLSVYLLSILFIITFFLIFHHLSNRKISKTTLAYSCILRTRARESEGNKSTDFFYSMPSKSTFWNIRRDLCHHCAAGLWSKCRHSYSVSQSEESVFLLDVAGDNFSVLRALRQWI